MILDYISLALKNIRKRGIRSWLTMLGIFIGIAAVVALISMGDGLQGAIEGQFAKLGPDKLVIQNAETGFGAPGSTAVRKFTQHDIDLIEKVPGVDVLIPRFIRIAAVEYNKLIDYKYLTNLPEDEKKIKVMYQTLNVESAEGRLLTKDDMRKVVLGSDVIGASYDKKIRVGSEIKINGENFQVIGILKKASTFTINSVIFMNEKDLKRVLNTSDVGDIFAVQVTSKDITSQVASAIKDRMRKDRAEKIGEEDFTVQTPEQSLQTINTVLSVINLIIAGIAAISLIVGGIGIMNTMYTAVLERKKEIGVMKAVGAKNLDILGIFLTESALLGLVGGIIGAIIGLSMALFVAFIVTSFIPGLNFVVNVSWPLLTLAILFSLVVGTVSGIVPALQASGLRPVEALRA